MTRRTRPVALGPCDVVFERCADGAMRVRSPHPLAPYPDRLTSRLEHWANVAPGRVFLTDTDPGLAPGGGRRAITYGETLARVRSMAAALLQRGLSPQRPIAILSGNDIEHAVLALSAMYVGIPYAPLSTAYSLISRDFSKLRDIIGLLQPGLVYVSDGAGYGRAIATVLGPEVELVVARNPPEERPATDFLSMCAIPTSAAVDTAHDAVGPDTVGKVLFTSGSTGKPKGVITTNRMLCSNQQILATAFPFLGESPPELVDWLPWNHVFGGSHNFGIALWNGGTLHIDEGKPLPGAIEATARNLQAVAPTVYFNVPKGFEMLLPFLKERAELRERFFSKVQMLFFAGAGLSQHVWDAYDALALETTGECIQWMTGLGATESAPYALGCRPDVCWSGVVGLPAPGVDMKLVPTEGKVEVRLKGPGITPGFWRQPELTAAAFDPEGYYRLGDAVKPVDPEHPEKGYLFDGRISEDFKLTSGTWVSVGPLRARSLDALAPLARDVVIAGHDRDDVRILIFPDVDAVRAMAPADTRDRSLAMLLAAPEVQAAFRSRLEALEREATGSASRVVRAILLLEPPSIDAQEMTDKGSINQRAVIAARSALVDRLYAGPAGALIIG